MYTFVDAHNEKFPNLKYHLWKATAENFEEFLSAIYNAHCLTTATDPHMWEEKYGKVAKMSKDLIGMIRHPKIMRAHAAIMFARQVTQDGYVLLNKVGACIPINGMIIDREIKKKVLTWSTKPKVYISKWPQANHYYLHASYFAGGSNIEFPNKYNTYEEAYAEALKHTTKDLISDQNQFEKADRVPFIYAKEGD